jgi:UDP-N-acetylmuramoyl-tripeptide--D-alanyl-D-alanine ligase
MLQSPDITALYERYLLHPSVQTDTRKLKPGDIFFALKGPYFNGNSFAQQALDSGAAYTVIDEAAYATDERCILVEDALETLQALARHHRKQFNIPFIAITGSNGKTTTKELVTAVLRKRYKTYATIGNFNNHIGVPLTLLSIGSDAEMAIIEMGANHLHEIESYCRIALPTHGIVTNCGKAHIEGFGSVENIRKGKGELFVYLRNTGGAVFRNTDLDYLEEMAFGIPAQITYGSAGARYTGKLLNDELLLKVVLLTHGAEALIRTQLVGAYNFPNVMVAITAGLHFGLTIDEVKEAIEAYTPDNSRSQWMMRGTNNVVLDAYNANPSSMRAAILNFAGLDLPGKRLWLGAMKEMGAEQDAEHRALTDLIKEYNWEQVVLVGDEFRPYATGFDWFATSAEASAMLKKSVLKNASILIKGSRGARMETLLDALPA